MKKRVPFIILLSLLFTSFGLKAQVIFSEDFDNIPGPTAGGAGTYVFPSGWLLANVDNRTPNSAVAYVNEAWERREDFGSNVSDSVAFSTSWYNPVGAADDWMWTPAIAVTSNCVLNWNAKAYDSMYPDGYEVRIMVAPTTPTGSTGVLGNMVSASTVLFSTAAESSSWTAHSVSLAAYAGQTVRIAFRNNSNDDFLLVIDDVVVQNIVNYDPQLLSYTAPSEYSRIPLQQQPSIPLSAQIINNGGQSVSNVSLTANVYDIATNGLVFTSSSATNTLASGGSAAYTTASPFVPAAVGNYRIEYVANGASDDVSTNNMLMDSISITDSTFARDRGAINGSLGIGAGNGGYLGQHYVSTQAAELTSVDIFLNAPVVNMHMGAAIFPMTNGYPDPTPLYVWPNMTINTSTPGWFHFQHTGSPLILMPDTFVVEAVEVDSTLSIGLTNQIFNNNTTWVDWPTNPVSPWGNNEDYGSSFAKSYMIRANLRSACASFSTSILTSTDASCGTCADGTATVGTVNGTGPFTYAWSSGDNTATANNLLPGTYTVTVTDASGCSSTDTVAISFSTGLIIPGTNGSIGVYPNPTEGNFNVSISLPAQEDVEIEVLNSLGQRIIYQSHASYPGGLLPLKINSPGMYTLKVHTRDGVMAIPVMVKN